MLVTIKELLARNFSETSEFPDEVKVRLAGRDFTLKVYWGYKDTHTIELLKIYKSFIKNISKLFDSALPSLYKYNDDWVNGIICDDNEVIFNKTHNYSKDKVFSYFIPEVIVVSDSMYSKKGLISIAGSYKYDIEHGLSIQFKDNKLYNISLGSDVY